jgi:Ala-tRNA(Pro) deacylase
MTTQLSIERFLELQRIPFSTFTHRPAYTAQEEAAVSHIPGWSWAKTIVCVADDQPIFAVLPAPCMIDFERLRLVVGAKKLRLASEDEMSRLYPGCEVGATPPLGTLYKQRVFVDQSLFGDPEMVFDAGSHGRAIRMHYGDFAEVAKPVVGSFGCLPKPGRTASQAQTPGPATPLL